MYLLSVDHVINERCHDSEGMERYLVLVESQDHLNKLHLSPGYLGTRFQLRQGSLHLGFCEERILIV